MASTVYRRVDHVIYKCGPTTGHVLIPVGMFQTAEIAAIFHEALMQAAATAQLLPTDSLKKLVEDAGLA